MVVGFSKYPFAQARKSSERKLRAMEKFLKALNYLDAVLKKEKIKARGIDDLKIKFSKIKEIQQVEVDRIVVKSFMYPSGAEHIRVFFHFTHDGKPMVIGEIFKGNGCRVAKLNGLLGVKVI